LRRRLDIAACRRKIKRLPKRQELSEIIHLALSDRAIGAQQVPFELAEFAKLILAQQPKVIVEIGTSRGGTLFTLCRLAPPTSAIISIDMPGAGFGEAYTSQHVDLFNLFPSREQTLHVITADSHQLETRERVISLLSGREIDLLFIDGDHSYEGVKTDFQMFSPLVAESGSIVLHDIAESTKFPECRVKAFWDEVKCEFRHREIVADQKQGWAGIGVLWKSAGPKA
jgi:cephalosporin hydroxylase